LGALAKHFGGALPFRDLEQMTPRQVDRYYRIYEYQTTEEEIYAEYRYPTPPAKPREPPPPERMHELVKERIQEKCKVPLDK